MAVTTRGDKPAAADAILFAPSSTNISKPTTELQDSGYATQARPGSANYNWLFNYVSAGIAHEFVYGIAEYDSGETYVANSYTNRLGLIYRSRTAGNIGNVPESSPTQWHDIRTPLEFVISATETHAPQSLFHELLTCDASVAGFTLTVDDGLFDGQKILVSVPDDATGLVYVKGTGTLDGNNKRSGIYSGASDLGTPISAGLSLSMEWSSTRSQWVPVNAVTADYVSGGQNLIQSSDGTMDIIVTETKSSISISANTGVALFGPYTYIIPFSSYYEKTHNVLSDTYNLSVSGGGTTTELTTFGIASGINGTNTAISGSQATFYGKTKGKY